MGGNSLQGKVVTCAAIDIGTNTLLMLIGRKNSRGEWEILRDEHNIARLGQGVDSERKIQPQAVERAKQILSGYKKICEEFSVHKIRAVGTSALRDAKNRAEVCAELSSVIGAPVEVIPGDEEARLSFLGTIEGGERSTVIDIGGGSTEIITGEQYSVRTKISLNIGAVRLTERFFLSLPADEDKMYTAKNYIRQELSRVEKIRSGRIFAVAGTPTTLAAVDQNLPEFSADRIHGHILTGEKISALRSRFLSSTVEEILRLPGVHPKRADILPAGTLILEEILAFLGAESCRVSVKGLRYGILYEALEP